MSNAISRRDFLKVTGAVGAAGLLAACGGGSSSSTAAANSAPASVAAPTGDAVELSISWWGGESRHEAYQAAIAAFSEANSNITVNPTFAAWSGWEDTMSTKFAGGVAEDVCQVNWNWLYNYSGNGQTFIDLNSVSDYIDLSQWDESVLNTCVVADMLQAIPVSMTGRIFYWNMTTFNKAGITLFQHNHAFEFERIGGELKYDIYTRLVPGIKLELDAYWTNNFGAENPVEMLKKFRDRMVLLHLKDGPFRQDANEQTYKNGILDRKITLCPLGQGDMEIPELLAETPETIREVIVEHDYSNKEMWQTVTESYEYMTKNGLCAGNV